jgi:hypothetical protein
MLRWIMQCIHACIMRGGGMLSIRIRPTKTHPHDAPVYHQSCKTPTPALTHTRTTCYKLLSKHLSSRVIDLCWMYTAVQK